MSAHILCGLSDCLRHSDYGDVVFLTESLRGLGDLCRRGLSANQFQDTLEAGEVAGV